MHKSIIHKAPFFILTLALVIGIMIENALIELPPYFYWVTASISFAILVFQFLKIKRRKRINHWLGWLYFFFFIAIGMLRYQQTAHCNEFSASINTSYTATILSPPIAKSKSYRIDLNIDTAHCNGESYHINTQSIAYFEYSERLLHLRPGDCIKFTAYLNPPTAALNPEAFDYKAYLKRKDIFSTTYIKDDDWLMLLEKRSSLQITANTVQYTIVQWLKDANFAPEELGILAALTVGYKQLISSDQRQEYMTAGSTHILAVSGLHVGIVFAFLAKFFSIFGKKKKYHWMPSIIIIVVLWCFALITGLTPSVTRATLMFSLISAGMMFKRHNNIFNTVFASAFIILLSQPQLLFDIGFQLSYCAVLGIVLMQPYFLHLLHEVLHVPKLLAELIGVSLAAQIATAPICIHTFNCFPVYFLLTNIWIIPLVGLIVNLALVFILLTAVGLAPTFLATLLQWLLKVMNLGVHLINELPHPLLTPLYIDKITVFALYLALAIFLLCIYSHSKRLLFSTLVVLFAISIWNINLLEQEKDKHMLYMFYDREQFSVSIQHGLQSHILSDSVISIPDYFIHHHVGIKHSTPGTSNITLAKQGVQFDRDFMIAKDRLYAIYSPKMERFNGLTHVDALIIKADEPKNVYQFYKKLGFNTLIIFPRPQKSIKYYQSFCTKNDITLHYIQEDGCYMTPL